MIKLIPYHPEHLNLIEAKEEDIARYGEINGDTYIALSENGVAFTAIEDGRILVIGGILQTSMHTGYCWTLISKHASKGGVKVFRLVKNQLEAMMRDMKIHRVETSNLRDAVDHHKWCKLLGFEEEGILKKYDDRKRDYIRFAKIMEV